VGDLYKYLTYFGWIADGGLIDAPGRIHRFGHESESFLTFIERSGVPVTGEYVHRITMRIAKVLQKNFRVKPRQHLSKSYRTSSKRIGEVISQEIKNPIPDDLIVALDPILDRFKCSSLLYRNYRNQAIHGFKVLLDEDEFFSEDKPFHGEFEYPDDEVVFHLEFPAKYLKYLLNKCLNTFASQLKVRKKLPSDLFNAIFSFEEIIETDAFEYLEEVSSDDFEDVKWRLKSR
jgi:hypothetical protein